MKRLFLAASLLLAFALPAGAETLTVAVAANMQYAFADLQAAYKKDTGQDVKGVFNSSGKFTAQIMNGAPFDVFLSADMGYPEKLYKAGFATAAPRVYANGALVLWTMKDIDLDHWRDTLSAPSFGKIAVANPDSAPYGREAMRALAHLKLEAALKPHLVFGESISQTNQYIHSGAVNAGFTAKSAVLAPKMKGQGKWIDVPVDAYQPIAQGAVILKHGREAMPQQAQRFYDFLYGADARTILQRYGYLLP